MTSLAGAQSEQVATPTPSPPVVVSVSAGASASASAPATADVLPTANQQLSEESAPAPSSEAVTAAARQIDLYLKSVGRDLEFHVDDSTGRTVVTVKDSQTGELIRQIPGEETLRLARALGSQSQALVDVAV